MFTFYKANKVRSQAIAEDFQKSEGDIQLKRYQQLRDKLASNYRKRVGQFVQLIDKEPIEVIDQKGIVVENGQLITTKSVFLRELNQNLGRSRDRQFRFKAVTSAERINDCVEKNKVCETTPSNLDKKAFIMRPRDESKEIGPPCFRNNSINTFDIIRSRIPQATVLKDSQCNIDRSIQLGASKSFKQTQSSRNLNRFSTPNLNKTQSQLQQYTAILSLKKYKNSVQIETELSKTFTNFDRNMSKKPTAVVLTPKQMLLEAKRQNANSQQGVRRYFKGAKAFANQQSSKVLCNSLLDMSEALNLNTDFLEATRNQIRNIPAPQVDPIDYTRDVLIRCNAINKLTLASNNLKTQKSNTIRSIQRPQGIEDEISNCLQITENELPSNNPQIKDNFDSCKTNYDKWKRMKQKQAQAQELQSNRIKKLKKVQLGQTQLLQNQHVINALIQYNERQNGTSLKNRKTSSSKAQTNEIMMPSQPI